MQISGLREIAYLADSFTTKGLDGQQFESITRIRFIAQDCLRDQTEIPVLPTPAQVELGKRMRGKERVRRKGAMKRRRKENALEYYEASEDDHSQFYDAVIEVDPLHLREGEEEMDELQLHQNDDEVDPQVMCLTPYEGNAMELNVVMNKVDDSHLIDATNDSNNSLPCISNNEVKYVQVCDARTKEIGDSEIFHPTNAANDSELCQATADEGNASNKSNDQLLHEPKIDNENESQLPESSKEANSLLPSDATEEAKDTQLLDATEEASKSLDLAASDEGNASQLHGAPKEGKDVLPLDPAEEEKDTLLRDVAENGEDLPLSDVTEKGTDSQLSAMPEVRSNSTLSNETKDEIDPQLLEAVEEGKDLQGDGLQLPEVTDEADDSLSADAKEAERDVPGSSLEIVEDVAKQGDKCVSVK